MLFHTKGAARGAAVARGAREGRERERRLGKTERPKISENIIKARKRDPLTMTLASGSGLTVSSRADKNR